MTPFLALVTMAYAQTKPPVKPTAPSKPAQAQPAPAEIVLKPGMVITKSGKVKPGVYRLPSSSDDGTKPAIWIKGTNITLDLSGVTIEGTAQTVDPDKRKGTGIRVEGANVAIRGGRIRGYKVGIFAKNSPKLKVLLSDLSYNWKQHLLSTPEKEDLADWMSYHKNEKDEWLRFGAAIYLRNCDEAEIKGVRAVGGQCGLMMTGCDKTKVWNNNFSFLSAIGLGMYQSSDNVIMHNKLDWCVRGYSHGVYNRGQDSSGILIYEQSHRNVFAYNSATHGGDGFFLWAGQTTMDTGKGGCNDNLLYANDLSHSPANAIEATFSRNAFVNNLLIDCWHGVWGGYSYETKIVGNVFAFNGESIAIEHGQNNVILGNRFYQDRVSLYLWQNSGAPDPNWGYPKFRDTRHMNTNVLGNTFIMATELAVHLGTGLNVHVDGNIFKDYVKAFRFDGKQEGTTVRGNRFTGVADAQNPDGVHVEANIFDGRTIPSLPHVSSRGGLPVVSEDARLETYFKNAAHGWNPWLDPRKINMDGDYTPEERALVESAKYHVEPLAGGIDPFIAEGGIRGRRYMIIDEWGPYDFKRPIFNLRRKEADGSLVFEVLGPKGTAKRLSRKGLTIDGVSKDGANWTAGGGDNGQIAVPSWIKVTPAANREAELGFEYEYVGGATSDYRGIVTPAGKPVKFGWSRFDLGYNWTIKFFKYDSTTQEPRTMGDAFNKLITEGTPIETRANLRELNFAWGGAPGAAIPADHFATVSETEVNAPKGAYTLNVTSDDGVRVFVDGKKVLENWTWHGPTLDTAKLQLNGKHRIRVEHFEIDGYSALRVDIVPTK